MARSFFARRWWCSGVKPEPKTETCPSSDAATTADGPALPRRKYARWFRPHLPLGLRSMVCSLGWLHHSCADLLPSLRRLFDARPLRHEPRVVALVEEDHAVQFVALHHGPASALRRA